MPTIIAYDVSLSMQRFIPGRSDDNAITYHQLATKGITQLLEYLSSNAGFKLEYVSLVTYSSECEVKVDFTRDYDAIRQVVKSKVDFGDKGCLIGMLKTVAGILATNWGAQTHCQLVIFTDCGLGFGTTSVKNFLQSFIGKDLKKEPEFAWLRSLRQVKLNFICMGLHSDPYFTRAIQLYQQLLDFTGCKGQLYMTKPPKDGNAAEPTETHGSETAAKIANIAAIPAISASAGQSHKSELGRTAMFELVERLCEGNFKPYEATLKCGGYFRLECAVLIWPPPPQTAVQPLTVTSGNVETDSENKGPQTISSKLEICGYLALSEIGSPASLSRHIVIPKVEREKPNRRSSKSSSAAASGTASGAAAAGRIGLDINQPNYEFEKLEMEIREFYTKDNKDSGETDIAGVGGSGAAAAGGVVEDATDSAIASGKSTTAAVGGTSSTDPAQRESMCVLLHGALKVENLAALVQLSDNWYGFLYSYADSKKKSNLMLNILPPGTNVIPWLGDLQMLGLQEDLLPGEAYAFPVKAEKRSYSQSCVVWIRHVSLQSDTAKVLRHAKKMPEKTQHFYKELNRIRRAAVSIGFVELLEALATLFDKESANTSNPECSLQLKHAAIELRKPSNRDLKMSIVPMQQKFPTVGGAVVGGGVVEGAGAPGGGFVY